MIEKFYHPILTALGPVDEEFANLFERYLKDIDEKKDPYFLITEDGKTHIMSPFNHWVVADGTVPDGVFHASMKCIGDSVVRYKTRILEGRKGRAYDYKTEELVEFGEQEILTHYMPLPLPPMVMTDGEGSPL